MNAPRRWLDDADAPGNERALLQAGLALEPPEDAQSAVWAALLAKVPPPGAPPPAHPPAGTAAAGKAAVAAKGAAAAGAAAGAGILKSALIGAGSAVALLATYSVVAPAPSDLPAPPPAVTAIAAPTAVSLPGSGLGAPPALTAAPPAPPEAPEPSAAASSAPAASASAEHRAPEGARPAAAGSSEPGGLAPPADRETLLREESRQVGEARDAVRRGDAAGALAQLEQIRARFPGGGLAQEREALTIEALARSGRRADAAARAAAFLQAYPTSPLAPRVQTLANN